MSWLAEDQDAFSSRVRGDDDDWGSDFEGELCSQEIEDNKINEIREANLKNLQNNVQSLSEDNPPAVQVKTKTCGVNATKTGAIPKTGFSYLNNTAIIDAKRGAQFAGNNAHLQRQVHQPESQSRNVSMNSENFERQPRTQISSNGDAVTKKTPKKLKPEAFSFLNKLPQKNVTENNSDVGKERKTLVPTVFSHAEKLASSQSQDDTTMIFNESIDEFLNEIPSAPPLVNTASNYEPILEDSFSNFGELTANIFEGIENAKPPLPSRPPPVFKYPPETFSCSRQISTESTSNLVISQPFSQSIPTYPQIPRKLGHSISSPDSGLKYTSHNVRDEMLKNKEKKRVSLPSAVAYPAVPKRPLPPLPITATENVSRIKSQTGITKIENLTSVSGVKLNDGTTIHGRTAISQVSEEASSPQQRLAQILTSQTSVDGAVLLSQQEIACAVAAKASVSPNKVSSLHRTVEPRFQNGGRPQETTRVIPGRSKENGAGQSLEDELEGMPSYLEAKEAVNPRKFPDHETLIHAMNRPALPQKAPAMQRSVSCNSLVQSIKDLSFSVWSKPDKKRHSEGISLSKKNTKSISVANSSKVKCTAPLSISSVIPTEAPSEVTSHQQEDSYASPLDEKIALQDYLWFHDVDAKEGQLRLLSVGLDGTFLIRPSSRPTEDIQNTMCILYDRKVRNLHIRRTAEGRYVLGTKSSKNFPSIAEMIRYHQEVPVEILPNGSTPITPQLYRILLREAPPKIQKRFAFV